MAQQTPMQPLAKPQVAAQPVSANVQQPVQPNVMAGQPTSIWKKWWVWTIIAVVALVIIGAVTWMMMA